MEKKTIQDKDKENSTRVQKVSEAFQHELSQILLSDVRDPRLAGVWVTQVTFSPDLRLAKIYFQVSGGRVREDEVIKGFVRSKSFLRHELSQRVKMKYTPDLKFFFDESFEENQRLDELFRKLEETRNGDS